MRIMFLVLSVLFLSACETLPTKPFNDTNTGITLAPVMGGLPIVKKTNYPDPRLGVSYSYRDNAIAACSLYIYNGGQTSITQGVNSEAVKNEFQRAKSDVIRAGDQGYYKSLKELKEQTRTISSDSGNIKYLESSFSFIAQDFTKISHLLLTGVNGHFVKVRCTYLEKASSEGEKAVSQFLSDLSKEIKSNNAFNSDWQKRRFAMLSPAG